MRSNTHVQSRKSHVQNAPQCAASRSQKSSSCSGNSQLRPPRVCIIRENARDNSRIQICPSQRRNRTIHWRRVYAAIANAAAATQAMMLAPRLLAPPVTMVLEGPGLTMGV